MMAVTHSQLGQICCTIIHSHSRTGCGNGLQYNHQLSTTNLPQLCCCTESVTTRRVDFVCGLVERKPLNAGCLSPPSVHSRYSTSHT